MAADIAIDDYGDIYVASRENTTSTSGVINVFDSSGHFLTELSEPTHPNAIAVDSAGNLYVLRTHPPSGASVVARYTPTVYDPEAGDITYPTTPTSVALGSGGEGRTGIAVDAADGHVYVLRGSAVFEYGSAAEGNPLLDGTIGEGVLKAPTWLAVDRAGEIYVSSGQGSNPLPNPPVIRVFGAGAGHPLERTIDGSCLPAGHFATNAANGVGIAVDESTGDVFADDTGFVGVGGPVYEFTETGACVSTIEHEFEFVFPSSIAVDNGVHSPNGALNPRGHFLYVPSGEAQSESHVFAFEPRQLVKPPEVESASASNISTTEAELHASVNPGHAATHYTVEYTTQRAFESEGFAGAGLAGEGEIAAGALGVPISASAVGLEPQTAYRFRVYAENQCETVPQPECNAERQASFATFSVPAAFGSCPNDALRTGASAMLPDCRAYELVSPADTAGRSLYEPQASPLGAGDHFGVPTSSPDGDSVAFMTIGGAIPSIEGGAGAFSGTPYVATRGGTGWQTKSVGPTGAEATNPSPGGLSPDHEYVLTTAIGEGSLVFGGLNGATYVRHPDGSLQLLGQGGLGTDPNASAFLITAGGSHTVFTSEADLESGAPPQGTPALYDRTLDETAHVISLLPGNVTPAAGEAALFEGASADGSVVAFRATSVRPPQNSPLYLRVDDERTVEVAGPGAVFEGLSADGHYAFYLSGGDLYRYDTEGGLATRLTTTHDVTVINVPASGQTAYFVSPSVLTGAEHNPDGAVAQAGEENLYLWEDGHLSFVATVTERDVVGRFNGVAQIEGLGLWVSSLRDAEYARDPSRSDRAGSTLIFASRAALTAYDPEGEAEIYRFDATEDTLSCLSCAPTRVPPSGDASLESNIERIGGPEPTGLVSLIPNLSPDGRRAFFQTPDALVPEDTDGVQDVYEWEADGEGSCVAAGGCVYLISSGYSAHDNYLYGVSESGRDVFISTSDLLLPSLDADETPSIYDARVEGGFPETAGRATECLGEACQPAAVPPSDQTPGSAGFEGSGNVSSEPRKTKCAKSKKLVRQGGKTKCVARHKAKKNHKQKKHAGHGRGRSAR
ncbi:MAG TPA: hypothetical protein VMH33_09995 [Solirubrobacterales bacterium]|nr:hypothetical protein [Solirubrobacterales bacterium]